MPLTQKAADEGDALINITRNIKIESTTEYQVFPHCPWPMLRQINVLQLFPAEKIMSDVSIERRNVFPCQITSNPESDFLRFCGIFAYFDETLLS